MRYQDEVVRITQKALDDVCRSALAIPADKADWIPQGEARSVLNQMQEIAVAATWFMNVIQDLRIPREKDQGIDETMVRAREGLKTIDACVDMARATTSDLCRAIASFPEEALEVEVTLPFGPGQAVSMGSVLYLHAWNLTYHLGQINQIQLMLGDREMH
ncbi:MAG: hypothetical protein QOJ65_1892 [Fimbriimonadaceae bacterium]|jgi:hypothetical protein|nr:hypothetical protein [Fimbriimonadaceae bacterium]